MPDAHRFRFGLVAMIWAIADMTGTAWAADLGAGLPPPPEQERPPPRQWTVTFAPYGWLVGLDGSVTVKGRTTDIDIGAFKLLEHLDGVPVMSYGEIRNGRLALYGDIVYAPLGADAGRARSFRGVSLDATLGVDITETIAEIGVVYEIGRWWSGGAIDLLAGARYWRLDAGINLAVTGTLDTSGLSLTGNRAVARAGSVDWTDPLVGLRVRQQLAPGHELLVRGDIGGFDVGSQFSWNVLAAYSWEIGVHYGATFSGVLGYRALSVDYEKGSGATRFEFDVVEHGPVVGLTVRY